MLIEVSKMEAALIRRKIAFQNKLILVLIAVLATAAVGWMGLEKSEKLQNLHRECQIENTGLR